MSEAKELRDAESKQITRELITKKYRCYDCNREIHRNDDAEVCIECGGMNRLVAESHKGE